jgi:hypothetical protein
VKKLDVYLDGSLPGQRAERAAKLKPLRQSICEGNSYDALIRKVGGLAGEIVRLQSLAAEQYAPEVGNIIASRSRDARRIEQTLDRLLDIAGHPAGLALFKTLCRYYFPQAPAATAEYIHAYRELWDSEEIAGPNPNPSLQD